MPTRAIAIALGEKFELKVPLDPKRTFRPKVTELTEI